MLITNDCIGCKPIVSQAKTDTGSIFSSWKNKEPVVELEILFGDSEYKYLTGGKVYIRPYLEIPPFMKETFTLREQEFILVPKIMIVGYEAPYVPTGWSTAVSSVPSIWQAPSQPVHVPPEGVSYTVTYNNAPKNNCPCGCSYCKFEV